MKIQPTLTITVVTTKTYTYTYQSPKSGNDYMHASDEDEAHEKLSEKLEGIEELETAEEAQARVNELKVWILDEEDAETEISFDISTDEYCE